jgi:hypothetical protein
MYINKERGFFYVYVKRRVHLLFMYVYMFVSIFLDYKIGMGHVYRGKTRCLIIEF